MKRKDLLTIATVAVGTATLTVAAFWARPIEAGAEADAPATKINQSRIVAHGIEMTLRPAVGRPFQAGDQPEFELTALNTSAAPADASVFVTMNCSSPTDAFSRVISIPTVLWQQQQMVRLQPKEKKTFTLCASTNLPPNKLFTVLLSEQAQKHSLAMPGLMVLTFSTVVPKAAPTVAAVR